MNKSKEVASRLLVASGHPAILLEQVDEPLNFLSLLVQRLIIITSDLPILLRRDHRLGPLFVRFRDDCIAVVGLVPDECSHLSALHQRLSLGDVGHFATGQDKVDRVPQGVNEDVDFGAESAQGSTKGRVGIPFFTAPAECGWARITVLAMIIHSRSWYWGHEDTVFHTP